MSSLTTALKLLLRPRDLIEPLGRHGLLGWMPDRLYLRLVFRSQIGRKLDLKAPKSFNEKLQWLKLYNRDPRYSLLVDKYEVKGIVAGMIGEEYIIPTYGIWDSVDAIEWERLPDRFVMKCTHDSGSVVLCRDRADLDVEAVKKKLRRALRRTTYGVGREWPYKNVRPRIIAEQYLDDGQDGSMLDYKVLCFDGTPKLIELHRNRYTARHTQDIYDTEWNRTDISQARDPLSEHPDPRPACLEEMLALSAKLAEGMPHVRVDWYIMNGQLYFGELTFFDGSGFCPFDNYDDDLLLGSWMPLDKVKRQQKK